MRRFESYRGHFFYDLTCANAVIDFSSRDAAHLAIDCYVRQFRDMKIIPTTGLIAPPPRRVRYAVDVRYRPSADDRGGGAFRGNRLSPPLYGYSL